MSAAPAWECQRSVDVDVPRSFAWRHMADVGNWSDPPAEFGLDGPFASGSQGWTRMPGQPAHAWVLRDVEPERGYTVVGGSFLDRAELIVYWRFDSVTDGKTRLTQRLELCGENAARYADDLRAAFEPNLEPGLKRIARLMEEAQRKTPSA
jgi:hypothetical protein